MVYAVSDFHGNYEAWKNFRSTLNPDDICYVLGDSCDRGDGGIKILEEIMEDERFRYIIGNHDDFIVRYFRPDLVCSRKFTSTWAERCWRHNKGPSIDEWLKLRRNKPGKFYKLINWLCECDVFLTVFVGGVIYRLAHAKYPKELDEENILRMSWKDMEAYDSELLQSTIWDRYDEEDIENFISPKCISVIGHTPVSRERCLVVENLLNLDSALGYGYNSVRVLCLSNRKIYSVATANWKFTPGHNKSKRIIPLDLICFRNDMDREVSLETVANNCSKKLFYAQGYTTDPARDWYHAKIDTSKIEKIHVINNSLVLIETLNTVYKI